MSYSVSITSQGQISIPAKIRRQLGLSKTSKAIVSLGNGKVIIEPVKDFLTMRGSLKTDKKPLSNKELHDLFAASVAKEYGLKVKGK